ncbi:MAG TPA: zf-HC2 domain-containing protein [Gemmatimonadales bacterium]|nr:zf-HC2 domain-containing protein [Gemmatimonadales bacterium]
MRHIPEEELHSYLDQALSRSQCVEIESHLARCAWCRASRDGIAALRDRTTALLSTLTPVRHRIPPSWESLSLRAAARSSRHVRLGRAGLWAASIAAAVALGWAGQALLHRAPLALPQQAAQAVLNDSGPVQQLALQRPGEHTGTPEAPGPVITPPGRRAGTVTAAKQRVVEERSAPMDSDSSVSAYSPSEPVGSRLSAGGLPSRDFGLSGGGMWRTLSWDNAQRERGESVPRIRGLPVVEVQVAAASRDSSGQPTMIVAQQLRSGQLIHTIEGPATDVTRLLASQRPEGASPWPTMDSDSTAVSDGTMAMRHGDRMLAIQASPSVPADSLRAMIRRLNAANR